MINTEKKKKKMLESLDFFYKQWNKRLKSWQDTSMTASLHTKVVFTNKTVCTSGSNLTVGFLNTFWTIIFHFNVSHLKTIGPWATAHLSEIATADVMQHFSNPVLATNERIII